MSPHSTHRVYLFSLRIDVPGVGERSLQWLQYLLQLRLLAGHEVQLMLQSLLVQPDSVDLLVESDYLVPILNEELVPGVHLSGLVDEHLLQILQLQCPFVYILLQLSEGHVGGDTG